MRWWSCWPTACAASALRSSACPAGGSELLEGLAGAGAGDLVVLFGFSKLSAEARVLLDHSAAAGYRTLLFTARQYPAHSAAGHPPDRLPR